MTERNRYEAPSNPPSVSMERRLALMLLDVRVRGYTLARYFHWQIRTYVLQSIVFALAILYFVWLGSEPMVFLMAGVFLGSLLRDLGIARNQARTWPIQKKLLNWDSVERMAAGEPIDA